MCWLSEKAAFLFFQIAEKMLCSSKIIAEKMFIA